MAATSFIDGVYNYCDRWCERCRFTARCRVFAMHSKHDAAGLDPFESVAASLAEARAALQHAAVEYRVDVGAPPAADDLAREEAQAALAAGHPLTVAAREYMELARARIGALALDGPAGPLEVIQWFHTMIFVKVHRAVSGRLHDEETDPEWPSDADGSAKVALMGIEESLVAWTDVSSTLPATLTSILPVIEHLDRLRCGVEAAFPGARAFLRPGFDVPGDADTTPGATSTSSS